MNLEKFSKIVKGVRSVYPAFKFIENKEGMNMWLLALEDVPDDVVSLAFQEHLLNKKYPPSIADIRELILKYTSNIVNDWTEGFDLTRRAIQKFGSYQEQEALDWINSQNPIAGEVTRRLGFKEICLAENIDVIRGQYRMAYERHLANEKNFAMLPTSVRDRQRAIKGKYKIDNVIKQLGESMGIWCTWTMKILL